MYKKLNDIIIGSDYPGFKSEGERRIAYFLDNNSIRYQYEQGVLINSYYGKSRIWYPDFYLPEFKSYVEYFGMAGRPCYDRGIKQKENVYSKMGLDVISVYPWMFKEDWKGYLMRGLKRNIDRQYRSLKTKPYMRGTTPTSYKSLPRSFSEYKRGFTGGY